MLILDVLHRLADASTRKAKEAIILEAYSHNCIEFFESARLAADPFMVFGLKKVAAIIDDDSEIDDFAFADFKLLCQRLHVGLPEKAAHAAVHDAAERCQTAIWNQVYRKILLKDLPIERDIINAVLTRLGPTTESLRIPFFQCQKATRTSKPTPLHDKCLIDVNLDGQRVLAVLDHQVRLYTTDGALTASTGLERALRPLSTWVPAPVVLDGVCNQSGVYHVFDVIPFTGFRDRYSPKTQRERRAVLETLHRSGVFSETTLVRVLPQIEIDYRTDEGKLAYREFCVRAAQQGHSEVVIKKPDAAYYGKRSKAWLVCKIELPVNT